LQTALKIFVILKSFNTINSKKTPPYSAGSFIFVDTNKVVIINGHQNLVISSLAAMSSSVMLSAFRWKTARIQTSLKILQ